MQSTMTEERTDIHHPFEDGEDMYRLAAELKMQERRVIDFSASANPLGVSKKVKADLRKHLKYLHNYPDPEAERLRKRLAQYFAIDPETILCGNGSTELLYLIPESPQSRPCSYPGADLSGIRESVPDPFRNAHFIF